MFITGELGWRSLNKPILTSSLHVSEDKKQGVLTQAALPGPVVPPAAGSWEVAVPAAQRVAALWSSASWGHFWVQLLPPHPSPVGHIWKNVQPGDRGRKNQLQLRPKNRNDWQKLNKT